jgi:hypothetical protein
MIKDQEVMLKDSSFYKTSPLGDEAATNGLGAGVITHVITGKTYFIAWSMDVQFEGQNVDRHTDLTTSNHASPMANAQAPMMNAALMAPPPPDPPDAKCECCGKPRHQGQKGGTVVSEDEWYGVNEQIPDDPPPPGIPENISPRARDIWAEHFNDLVALEERRNKLANRRQLLQKARECKLVADPPCNVYRVYRQTKKDSKKNPPVITAARKKKEIEAEWDIYRKRYQRRMGIENKQNVKVNHKTPKSAGGCPTGANNLVPDAHLSKECKAVSDQLDGVHNECAERWQTTGF